VATLAVLALPLDCVCGDMNADQETIFAIFMRYALQLQLSNACSEIHFRAAAGT
jgi:hypothetical protein